MICGSCGYESLDTARFCSHCGAALAASVQRGADPNTARSVSPEGDVPPVAPPSGPILPETVAGDMRRARAHLDLGRVDLARMFGRNALALNLLSGDDPEELRSKAILHFLEQCTKAEGRVRRRCPLCSGTGKRMMTAQTLKGESREFQVGGSQCERCAGVGTIRGAETFDERKYRLGRSDEKYRTLQQSHGRVPVGLAWVPAEVADGLKVADAVVLKRALPPPCSHCMGLGRDDCTSCRGSGKVSCGSKDCQRGMVERESLGGQIGSRSRSGSGRSLFKVKCPTCGGTALETCEKCSGSGSFLCKSCGGAGLEGICSKCGGAGLLPCRRCGGTLTYRGESCTACRAEGSVECSSCGGTGRK
ncbi:MAG: zinc-ribbon domain-containing protein [Verrucomicrobia bacterium]|nr:zinc-ribbon domain-containing protein [Verrucomicrobiota bacterium]